MTMPVALRQPAAAGTSAVGSTTLYCVVLDVDEDKQIATVVDQLGQRRTVTTTRMFGKATYPPQRGESWILSAMFGDWIFAVQINASKLDTGWLTTGLTPLNSTTITAQQYRRVSNQVTVTVEFTLGVDITVPSSGNISNLDVVAMPPGFISQGTVSQGLTSASLGPILSGRINAAGNIAISATAPGVVLNTGTACSLSGIYLI